LQDAFRTSFLFARRVPGLRSGFAVFGGRGLRLHDYGYVPGIAVTGDSAGALRITGKVRARARVRNGRLTLTIGGRTLTGRA
jgi:hypothetical protein